MDLGWLVKADSDIQIGSLYVREAVSVKLLKQRVESLRRMRAVQAATHEMDSLGWLVKAAY